MPHVGDVVEGRGSGEYRTAGKVAVVSQHTRTISPAEIYRE